MVSIPSFKIKDVNSSKHFFGYPNEIGDILYSDSTLYKDYVFDSIWAKLHKNKKFYNFFVGKKGVEIFTLYPDFSVSREVIFYDDKDFKDKIKKYNNYQFCKKSMQMYNKNKGLEISFESEKIDIKDIVGSIFSIISVISFFVILAGVFYIDARLSGGHILFDMFISLVIWVVTFSYIQDKYIDKKECL